VIIASKSFRLAWLDVMRIDLAGDEREGLDLGGGDGARYGEPFAHLDLVIDQVLVAGGAGHGITHLVGCRIDTLKRSSLEGVTVW
jgi:hypothetical protein